MLFRNKPPAIISLTEQGRELAICLQSQLNHAEHYHCPKPFAEQVQALFLANTPLIFIAATGIVVRTLAPVLRDKKTDPPVLVLDQAGKFVIPLLSGHEGGANRWAKQISQLLSAQLVLTTAKDYTKAKLVVGMGCDKSCPINLLEDVLYKSLAKIKASVDDICAIASIDRKQNEASLIQLSKQLNVPFVCYSAQQLRTVEHLLSQKSDIVFREVGVYGVAEAAALFHAQQQNHTIKTLAVPKQKNKRATCAIVVL